MVKCYIPDYPRPQFVRSQWQNLNGKWNFAFDDENQGEKSEWFNKFPAQKEINAPFTYETPLSGINEQKFHPVVWYNRKTDITVAEDKRVVINFEGSDYFTKVWVNGKYAGYHCGGYTRFSFDITELAVNGENDITVRVEDSFDTQQPRGKQRWTSESFGCWYVQTTGIWKTVWLEYHHKNYIEKVKMTPDLANQNLNIEWNIKAEYACQNLELEVEVSYKDIAVNRVKFAATGNRGKASINVTSTQVNEWGVEHWRPNQPHLYDIMFRLYQNGQEIDTVGSYFGMREIRIDKQNIALNNSALYQRLILDQGYWEDSHLTPPSEAAIIEDVDKIMQLGFNGARKHQKVEDERFAFWCDIKGLLLWCEMPSAYEYGDAQINMFTREWLDIVDQNYNHPCIITWTPFNESWGVPSIKTNRPQQDFTQAIYYLTKAIDPMRPVIVNDGWEHTISDIITLHDYEELGSVFLNRYLNHKNEIMDCTIYHSKDKSAMAQGHEYKGQPVIISEYGGVAFSGGGSGTWGYGNTVDSEESFLRRVEDITDAIKKLDWVCGYCYTQVTDVQQEINGLMDMKRNFKANGEEIRRINLKKV